MSWVGGSDLPSMPLGFGSDRMSYEVLGPHLEGAAFRTRPVRGRGRVGPDHWLWIVGTMEVGWGRNPTREEGSDLCPPMFRNQARQLCVHQGCLDSVRWLRKATSSKLGWTCYLRPRATNRPG